MGEKEEEEGKKKEKQAISEGKLGPEELLGPPEQSPRTSRSDTQSIFLAWQKPGELHLRAAYPIPQWPHKRLWEERRPGPRRSGGFNLPARRDMRFLLGQSSDLRHQLSTRRLDAGVRIV